MLLGAGGPSVCVNTQRLFEHCPLTQDPLSSRDAGWLVDLIRIDRLSSIFILPKNSSPVEGLCAAMAGIVAETTIIEKKVDEETGVKTVNSFEVGVSCFLCAVIKG